MKTLWRQLAIATNWPVLVAVAVLTTVGTLSIWADAHNNPSGTGADDFRKQLVFLAASIVCMGAFQAVNYQKIGRLAMPFYVMSLLLILYTVVGSKLSVPFVRKINGAYAWINFGPASLQPAELMKIAFVMVLAQLPAFSVELSHVHRAAGAVRAGADSAGADPQTARPGHGADLHPRAVRHALRRRGADQTPAGDRRFGNRADAGDLAQRHLACRCSSTCLSWCAITSANACMRCFETTRARWRPRDISSSMR